MNQSNLCRWAAGVAAFALTAGLAAAAEAKIGLPLVRTAYQTNEAIDVAVSRSDAANLAADNLVLTIAGDDASKLEFTFPVPAVAGPNALAVEHLRVNGRLLRPGTYNLTVAVNGATAQQAIEVYSHVRKSTFRIVNWGGSGGNKGATQRTMGEDNLGYNLLYGAYSPYGEGDSVRAGVDYMQCCTMSGGHQMDLRMECDWSDPWVSQGGRRRVVREAFKDRTRGNVIGVHCYDEPGLTWWVDPDNQNKCVPHMVPTQVAAFKAAFDQDPLWYTKVDPKNPEHVARWRQWALWKLGFMDATWQEAQFGVSYVRPDFLTTTQSQYGWSAYTDGYYFNVVRSLPVTSGHGGYHDYGPGFFNPSAFLEYARGRDLAKPCWYLPTWYGNTTADEMRLEQYLSFQTNIQGMATPPDCDPFQPGRVPSTPGVVESNKLMLRLGTIFTTMPVTRPPVALLYSLSTLIAAQTKNMDINYAHSDKHGQTLSYTYLAGKQMHQQFLTVVDEDILDGTLATNHKAVILPGVDYLVPEIVAALEDFAAKGGLVLLTGDSAVQVKGAINLGVTPGIPEKYQKKAAELKKQLDALNEKIKAIDAELAPLVEKNKQKDLTKEQKDAIAKDMAPINERKAPLAKQAQELGWAIGGQSAMQPQLEGALPLAKAIKAQLDKAGIKPVFECDQPGIVATRQAAGDLEYFFAVNATPDPAGNPMLGMKATDATISLPTAGRPVYDAVIGGPAAAFQAKGAVATAKLRFGPGAMKVFAVAARPIGGVKVSTPGVTRDFTVEAMPIRLELGAALLDNTGRVLSGSAPLRLRVIDPLGSVRYELYRATSAGVLNVTVPLAANDPAGRWTVTAEDLLANTQDQVTFELTVVPKCAAAGTVERAVFFPGDRKNIHRFFRLHNDVTIVVGTGDYNGPAAARLAKILEPWNVRCKVMPAAEAAKSRPLTEAQTKTWTGLEYTGRGSLKAGDQNPPNQAGFAIQGPVVLLGTPEDNPLIKALQDWSFLPYKADKTTFPGPRRGYVAWQFDGIGMSQESVTLVAYDAAGMSEAVGSTFEAMMGMDPLTPWTLPAAQAIAPATKADGAPVLKIAWTAAVPDHPDALKAAGDLTVLTHDGTVTIIDAKGKVKSQKVTSDVAAAAKELGGDAPVNAEAAKKWALPGRLVKQVAAQGNATAVGYWGGYVRVVDAGGQTLMAGQLSDDVCGLAWLGDTLVVGLSDGRVLGLGK